LGGTLDNATRGGSVPPGGKAAAEAEDRFAGGQAASLPTTDVTRTPQPADIRDAIARKTHFACAVLAQVG
jgi:hypothetical protein